MGLEVRKSGKMNLVVLDPIFKTSPALCKFIGGRFTIKTPEKLLMAYRRGEKYLKNYDNFEILK